MSFAFKRFSFFSQHEVPQHDFPPNAASAATGAGRVFAAADGALHVLDASTFRRTALVPAFGHRLLRLAWAEVGRQAYLIGVGVDEPGVSSASVKVWDGAKLAALRPAAAAAAAAAATADGAPSSSPPAAAAAWPTTQVAPLKTTRLFGSKYPEAEVTALAATDAAAPALTVAVGLGSGGVYVLQGDLAKGGRLHHLSKLSARPEQGDLWAVTALAFAPASAAASSAGNRSRGASAAERDRDALWLFAATESQTLSFNVADGGKTVLDRAGLAVGSACALRGGGVLVVGRPDALYDYTVDTRAGCTVFDGQKQWVAPFQRYLALAIADGGGGGGGAASGGIIGGISGTAAADTGLDGLSGIGAGGGSSAGAGGAPEAVLCLLDTRNKLVAGSFPLGPGGAAHVLALPDRVVAVARSGRLLCFREAPLPQQLEALFKRGLHKLALDVGLARGADAAAVAGVRQRWGDYLYERGDADQAAQQYLGTIGFLEPSYVIRRFLDAQRVGGLTAYLEALHAAGLAGADHTTLLLSCYTKQRDVAKLDAFIHGGPSAAAAVADSGGGGSSAAAAPRPAARGGAAASSVGALYTHSHSQHAHAQQQQPPPFDLETAFRVLRAAGYHSHALAVAARARRPEWTLDVLLEDGRRYDEALAFLETLPRRRRAELLRRHGKALIDARPEGTTRLLMDLCLAPSGGAGGGGGDAPASSTATAAAAADGGGGDEDGEGGGGAAYVAAVADFAQLYVARPTALMLLCEFVINSQAAPPGERALYHTLLELYLAPSLPDEPRGLHTAGGGGGGGGGAAAEAGPEELAQLRRDKARELLARGWQPHMPEPAYDAEHALLLCRGAAYAPGLVFLLERRNAHRDALAARAAAGDLAGVVQCCVEHGDASAGGDPALWPDALRALAGRAAAGGKGGGEGGGEGGEGSAHALPHLEALLAAIEERGALPPLVVVQALAAAVASSEDSGNGGGGGGDASTQTGTPLRVGLVKGCVGRALARDTAAAERDREAAAKLAAEAAAAAAEARRLKTRPYVFQSSRCAATGQPLELPVVHFLCGHSFNQRALGESDGECPLCAPDLRRVLDIRRGMRAGALQQDRFFSELRAAPDGFAAVADAFGRGLMGAGGGGAGGGGGGAGLRSGGDDDHLGVEGLLL